MSVVVYWTRMWFMLLALDLKLVYVACIGLGRGCLVNVVVLRWITRMYRMLYAANSIPLLNLHHEIPILNLIAGSDLEILLY